MQHLTWLLCQALCLLPLDSASLLRTPEHGAVGRSRHGAASLLQKLPQTWGGFLGSQTHADKVPEGRKVDRASQLVSFVAVAHEQAQKADGNYIQTNEATYDPLYFGLLVDAGSTGTRLRMFRWTLRSKVDLMEVQPADGDEALFEAAPLSAFANDTKAALPELSKVLKAAQGYVPKAIWSETLLFLKATAGMRLVQRSKAEEVMITVRDFLSDQENCPFKFVSADIISGEEEALFSFLTTNYNLGTLSSPSETAGALELGGASMQVIFRPTTNIQENEQVFYLQGERQSVYSKSYLKFGADQAMSRTLAVLANRSPKHHYLESPCHNRGFKAELPLASGEKRVVVGTGNTTACTEVIQKVMGLDIECLLAPCAIFGTYMSPVQGNFYAFAGFFYTVNGLGLVGWKDTKALTVDAIADATAAYCAKDMQTAQQEAGKPMKYAERYCFMGNYIQQILTVLGFKDAEDAAVIFSRKLEGSSLGFPAGAMLYETHLMPLSLTVRGKGPSLYAGESVRDLCGPTAKFGKPPAEGAAQSTRLATIVLAVLALTPGILR